MARPSKTIINLAPTGMIPTKGMNSSVPVTPQEIVDDVKRCVPLGVSMAHLHARGDDESPTHARDVFARIIEGVRADHPDLVVTVTTSGRTYQEFEQRSAVLFLDGDVKPDMASLTLGSVNFNRSASVSSPDMVVRLAEDMRVAASSPNSRCSIWGMVNFAHYLIKKDLFRRRISSTSSWATSRLLRRVCTIGTDRL